VIVGHDRKGVLSAKTRIDVIVNSARQREPFSHFLSIPVNDSEIQKNFAEFKSDVLRGCDGVIQYIFLDIISD
jgi:activating signal cointegrator complex subunit 1